MLEPEQHKMIQKIARQEKRSASDVIREMLNKQIAEHRRLALAAAAQVLLVDYQTDPELTAFNSLDGEDFNA